MTTVFDTFAFQTADSASVNRTLPDRLSDVKNVKDFGALGDGVTDDWASIMAAFNHDQRSLTVTGTNQTAAFTGQQAWASSFNGTVVGNTLTLTSALVGTIVPGQTVAFIISVGGTPTRVTRTILSGSGPWTLDGASATSIDPAMFTNSVLVVSSLSSGTIAIGNVVLGTGVYAYASFVGTISGTTLTISGGLVGTVAVGQAIFGAGIETNPYTIITGGSGSTWTVAHPLLKNTGPVQIQAWLVQSIGSQQSGFGTSGGNGVYIMASNMKNTFNVGPEAMTTVGPMITFASVPNFASTLGRYMEDLTTASAFNLVISTRINSATSTTITYNPSEIFGLVNIGDTITVNTPNKGMIYFPRGVYIVSKPIDFSSTNLFNVIFKGSLGETSIIGNFPDYVFKRGLDTTTGQGGIIAVEGFSVTNNHANGGGIRLGLTVAGGYVNDCTVIANRGINTASDDLVQGVTSQEIAINNCYLSPGTNTAGSIGIMSVSDGPIANCHIVGYDKGIITWGQQGDMIIMGCTIELCGYGLQPGVKPGGDPDSAFSMRVSGIWFKNCGTAINCSGSNTGGCTFEGITIDAAEGTISGNPQYGMRLDNVGGSFFNGIRVNGQYAQYGIEILDNAGIDNWMVGVQAFNTSSLVRPAWSLPSTGGTVHFVDCNVPPVFPVATLPAITVGINTIQWASGTTTLKVFFNVSNFANMTVTVTGISTSGYNGTFSNITVVGGFIDTLSYSQTGPLTTPGVVSGAAGAVINFLPTPPANSVAAAVEGDSYNVTNSDTSTWGGIPSATAGTVRAKVRWNGSAWTVIGK
jgi:hypothetical protein